MNVARATLETSLALWDGWVRVKWNELCHSLSPRLCASAVVSEVSRVSDERISVHTNSMARFFGRIAGSIVILTVLETGYA